MIDEGDLVNIRLRLRRDLVMAVAEIAFSASMPLDVFVGTLVEAGLMSHRQMESNRRELNAR